MRITRIAVWAMELPLARPYRLSGGRLLFEKLDSTFVRVDTDEGVSGWGEGCPWGTTYLPAHGPGVRAAIETIAPALVGHDPCAMDSLNRTMNLALPGHPYAKSPIDIACWDILGQVAGMPLWRLLGGNTADPIELCSSIGTGTADQMLADIADARAHGYRHHSAKVGGAEASTDITRIEAIQAALPAGDAITYDVNRAWTPGLAVQILNSVSARGWIEQPCENLDQCAAVASRVPQPILLDECLHSFDDHLVAWRNAACQGVKIKPNRVGGLTRARQIRDFGVAVGWRMPIEDVGGSALADTAAIHLATSTPAEHRLASWLGHAHLAVDPVPEGQGARNRNGMVTPPDTPGLGVAPDPDKLGEPVAIYGGGL